MGSVNKYIYGILALLLVASLTGVTIYQQKVKDQRPVAVIYKDGQIYQSIDLTESKDKQFNITDSNGHYNLVEIKDGRIRIKEADCPNKLCVQAGWLTKPGQIAVCMPNHVKVVIEGLEKDNEQPDVISF